MAGLQGKHNKRGGKKDICRAGHRKPLGDRCHECRKIRRAEQRALIDLAKSRPCTDCGKTYPPFVMDFDHVRGVKKMNVSKMRESLLGDILDEIAKCDVVCANCHRLRTFGRF